MTDDDAGERRTFTILLPEDLACDAATKALAERYIAAAAGDPVLAVLLACQDIAVLRDCASHGMRHGRSWSSMTSRCARQRGSRSGPGGFRMEPRDRRPWRVGVMHAPGVPVEVEVDRRAPQRLAGRVEELGRAQHHGATIARHPPGLAVERAGPQAKSRTLAAAWPGSAAEAKRTAVHGDRRKRSAPALASDRGPARSAPARRSSGPAHRRGGPPGFGRSVQRIAGGRGDRRRRQRERLRLNGATGEKGAAQNRHGDAADGRPAG